MKTPISLLVFLTSINLFAQSCPLGKNEDHLTIQRVMINFGKFVGGADHLVLLGAKYPNEVVDEEQLAAAGPALLNAAACAQAILDNPTDDLLPGKVMLLNSPEKEEYVQEFLYFMAEFKEALTHYSQSFAALSANKGARDWEALYSESREINELIDRAHRKTSAVPGSNTEVMPPAGDLKANMKEINNRYKAISAAPADLAQYPAFAVQADEISQIFAICKNQFPKAFATMPEPVKQKAVAEYQTMIQQGVDLAAKLATALRQKNTAAVSTTLQEMKKLKLDGHDKFDP